MLMWTCGYKQKYSFFTWDRVTFLVSVTIYGDYSYKEGLSIVEAVTLLTCI
jgi:hypothetical protein